MEILTRLPDGTEVAALETLGEIRELIALFQTIAEEEHWEPCGQLEAFLQSAVYLAVSVRGDLVGGLTMTRPSVTGRLPSHRVWPELPLTARANVAHVGVLALKKEVRGQAGLFWLPCVELWRFCQTFGITELWLEATPMALRAYRRLGLPLTTIGPLRTHWGEGCYPCSVTVDAVTSEIVTRAARSATYQALVAQGSRDGMPVPGNERIAS